MEVLPGDVDAAVAATAPLTGEELDDLPDYDRVSAVRCRSPITWPSLTVKGRRKRGTGILPFGTDRAASRAGHR